MISYTVLNGYNLRIKKNFAVFEDALAQLELDVFWGLTPVSLTTNTDRYDCEQIAALIAAQRAREQAQPC